jgi:tRNA(Arg) A34 adenosine deaminase TadA
MNNRTFNRLVEISKAMKARHQTGMRFHTTFFLKKGKIACIGWNNYNKLHRGHKFGEYKAHKSFKNDYIPSIHSECAAIIKLGEMDLSNYEICNVRIDNNSELALSMPCANCLKLISGLNPRRVYYSTSNGFEELI